MKKITLFTFLTILLCTSCVTKKKFMLAELAATASKDSLQGLTAVTRATKCRYKSKTSCVIQQKWETVSASIKVC